MKLLFDENLSAKLVQKLSDAFPESAHVHYVGLESEDDDKVWEYAREHQLTIVSKDSDFHEKSLLKGYPPKVVWIRRGNCTIKQIEEILLNHTADIEKLIADEDKAFLILF
jgi:predicted nuclease of predicted toxin-antitoxin system